MRAIPPSKPPARLRLAALLLALPILAQAQEPAPTPTPDPLAGVPVQVIDRQQVTIGTHTITYDRIVPPTLPAPTPPPKPGASPNAAGPAGKPRGVTRSAPQTSTAGEGEEKASRFVFLSATVYDHRFTALRFQGGSGQEVGVYVNLDFNFFAGVEQVETADTVYLLYFGLGNDTAASLTEAGRTPPNLALFPTDFSAYQVFAGDATARAEDFAALDALCAHYDAHQAQMVSAYEQREAANAARLQFLQEHPPGQADTVLRYWPVRSRLYLPSAN